jgi:hypothetical protein
MKGFWAEIELQKKLSKSFFELGVAIFRRVWL